MVYDEMGRVKYFSMSGWSGCEILGGVERTWVRVCDKMWKNSSYAKTPQKLYYFSFLMPESQSTYFFTL